MQDHLLHSVLHFISFHFMRACVGLFGGVAARNKQVLSVYPGAGGPPAVSSFACLNSITLRPQDSVPTVRRQLRNDDMHWLYMHLEEYTCCRVHLRLDERTYIRRHG